MITQAIMVKDLTLDMLSVLKKVSTLEENFLNGFWHLPPSTCATLKTHTKVEAFALMAYDLKEILESKLSLLEPEKLKSRAAIRVRLDKDNGNGVVLNPIFQVHRIT